MNDHTQNVTQEEPSKRALFAALHAAQREARALAKDGKNNTQGYRYTLAETIIDEGRTVLGGAGLVFFAGDLTFDATGVVPQIRVTFVLAHPESGASVLFARAWPVVEGKGRPLDKMAAASDSTLLAYTIRDLLLIPRDDEKARIDERDDRDYEPAKKEPPRPAAKATTKSVSWLAGVIEDIQNGKPIEPYTEGAEGEAIAVLEEAFAAKNPKAFPALGARARALPREIQEMVLDSMSIAYERLGDA